VNIINNATTTLQGSGLSGPVASSVLQVKRDSTTGDPALRVDNTSTSGAARGIDITVPSGETPISVNSNAAKANLNVDRFDGRDEQDFLSASRIYTVHNTEAKQGPGKGGKVTITSFPGPEDGLACDDGDVAVGAGGSSTDINDDLNSVVLASDGSYQITFQDKDFPSSFSGFVNCSDSSKPFK